MGEVNIFLGGVRQHAHQASRNRERALVAPSSVQGPDSKPVSDPLQGVYMAEVEAGPQQIAGAATASGQSSAHGLPAREPASRHEPEPAGLTAPPHRGSTAREVQLQLLPYDQCHLCPLSLFS